MACCDVGSLPLMGFRLNQSHVREPEIELIVGSTHPEIIRGRRNHLPGSRPRLGAKGKVFFITPSGILPCRSWSTCRLPAIPGPAALPTPQGVLGPRRGSARAS
jgi:hypothetical protein